MKDSKRNQSIKMDPGLSRIMSESGGETFSIRDAPINPALFEEHDNVEAR